MDKNWQDSMKKSLTEETETIVVGELRDESAFEMLEALHILTTDRLDHREILLKTLQKSTIFSEKEVEQIQERLYEIWKYGRF